MSLTKSLRSTRGFTLIELMVVIVIIGILATGAMSVFQGAQAKSRDAVRTSDLDALKSALEQYYAQNDAYPTAVDAASFKDVLSPLMSKWPKDPKDDGSGSGYQYVYCFTAKNGIEGQGYALATRFENKDGVKSGAMTANNNDGTISDEEATYVIGPDVGLVTTAATTTSPAGCTSSPLDGKGGEASGGIIAQS